MSYIGDKKLIAVIVYLLNSQDESTVQISFTFTMPPTGTVHRDFWSQVEKKGHYYEDSVFPGQTYTVRVRAVSRDGRHRGDWSATFRSRSLPFGKQNLYKWIASMFYAIFGSGSKYD